MNPYQPPTTLAREEVQRRVFRMKFWPPFLVIVSVPALVLVLTILIVDRELPRPVELFATLGMLLVVEAVAGFWIILHYRVYATEAGLRCFDFWGTYYEVAWDSVAAVNPIRFLGLPYLRLYSTGQPPIWLPMFLHHQNDFWKCVHECAPNTPVDHFGRRSGFFELREP